MTPRCNTLQHAASRCNLRRLLVNIEINVRARMTPCNILHHAATHCNTLQHGGIAGNSSKKRFCRIRGTKNRYHWKFFWLKIDVYDYIDICCLYLRFHGDLFVINRFLMISRFDLAALALPHVPRYLKLRPETNLSASRAKT